MYAFLRGYLPELKFDEEPPISFLEFIDLLKGEVRAEDEEKVTAMRSFFDVLNLLALFEKGTHDPKGNDTKEELEAHFEEKEGLPLVVFDTLNEKGEERELFPIALDRFLIHMIEITEGFLHDYFTLQREMRVLLMAHRALSMGQEVDEKLKKEGQRDLFLREALSHQEGTSYPFPGEYTDLGEALFAGGRDPLKQEKALLKYRFDKWGEWEETTDPFSIDLLLAYGAKLIELEDLFILSDSIGQERLDEALLTRTEEAM